MKIKHILNTQDFIRVLEKGRVLKSSHIAVYVGQTDNDGTAAVGTIIAKKVVPGAVRRNYIKRVIYAFFREQTPGPAKGAEIAVRIIRPVKDIAKRRLSREIRCQLGDLLKKTGIIL